MQQPHRRQALGLLLTLLFLVAAVPAAFAAPDSPVDPNAGDQLQVAAPPGAQISIKRGTGVVSSLRLAREAALALPGGTAEARAGAFYAQYGGLFGVRDAQAELTLRERTGDLAGGVHLAYAQHYLGVPVFGGELRLHFDAAGRLTGANGTFVPDIDVDPRAAITA